MKREELAIIKDIHVGMRDARTPICWFSVELLWGGALQVISIARMTELLESHSIYKLEDLNNKPCIVETNGNLIKFKDLK